MSWYPGRFNASCVSHWLGAKGLLEPGFPWLPLGLIGRHTKQSFGPYIITR